MKIPLDVKRIGTHALPLPRYAVDGDAGMDLRAHIPPLGWAEQQGFIAHWNKYDNTEPRHEDAPYFLYRPDGPRAASGDEDADEKTREPAALH